MNKNLTEKIGTIGNDNKIFEDNFEYITISFLKGEENAMKPRVQIVYGKVSRDSYSKKNLVLIEK